jgi:hypothetical protein
VQADAIRVTNFLRRSAHLFCPCVAISRVWPARY